MKIALFWSFSVCEGLLRDIRCGRTPKKCGNNFFSGRGLPFPVNIIAPRPRTSARCRPRLRPRPRRASSCAPWSCAPLVRHGGRARCPHRAAAPSARCVAWHPAPSLCVPLVRLAPYRTLPTRDAHVITHAHYPGGAMGTSRPTAITPAKYAHHYPRALPVAARRRIAWLGK